MNKPITCPDAQLNDPYKSQFYRVYPQNNRGNADLFSFVVPTKAGIQSNQVAGFPPIRE
jgi:hypothetical protein